MKPPVKVTLTDDGVAVPFKFGDNNYRLNIPLDTAVRDRIIDRLVADGVAPITTAEELEAAQTRTVTVGQIMAAPYGCTEPVPQDDIYQQFASHGVEVIEHKMPTSADMRAAIERKIAAGEPLGASHVAEITPGVFANGSVTGYAKYIKNQLIPTELTHRGNPKMKSRRGRCAGTCMPGLGGKCVACNADEDE